MPLDYHKLASTTSAAIRADLIANKISISKQMESLLAALNNNPGCWSQVHSEVESWLPTAGSVEFSIAWQSVIRICNQDGRPYAAYPLLYLLKDDAEALNLMYSTSTDAIPALRTAIAANPLVTAMPEAKAEWPRISVYMNRLSAIKPTKRPGVARRRI